MLMDLDPVSRWYVMSKGFKTYLSCTKCHSERIQYNKVRSLGHYGIASQCLDCKRLMPIRFKPLERTLSSAEARRL